MKNFPPYREYAECLNIWKRGMQEEAKLDILLGRTDFPPQQSW